jgi:hypothetical protein
MGKRRFPEKFEYQSRKAGRAELCENVASARSENYTNY